jgi:hypothetical protein
MASLDIIEEHLDIDLRNERLRNGRKRHDKNKYYYFSQRYYIVQLSGNDKWCIMSSNDRTREMLNEHIWRCDKGYAMTSIDKKTTLLHRHITDCDENKVVDHLNRKRFDNRADNLRICTSQDNNRNKPIQKNNSSGVTGVWKRCTHGRWSWIAQIQDNNGKRISKSFNINVLGDDEAKQRAIAWRRERERLYGYIGE